MERYKVPWEGDVFFVTDTGLFTLHDRLMWLASSLVDDYSILMGAFLFKSLEDAVNFKMKFGGNLLCQTISDPQEGMEGIE